MIARVWTGPEGELLPEASQQIEVADTPLRRNWTYRWTWIDLGDATPGLKGKLLSRWAVRSDAVDGKGRESSHGQTLEIDRFHPPGATGGGTTGSSEVRDPVPGREYAMWKAHVSSGTKSGARCRLTIRFVPARPDEAGITHALPYQPPAE